METAVVMKGLENLLVDEDLQRLEQMLGRFNIFDALGVARAEIRHSNFLAWLLDPYGSHGQGDLFLKAMLIDLLRQAPADRRPFSPVEIDGNDLRGVEIRREWRNIDLLITCKEPAFVVVIENKVGSREHSGQLNRYEKTARESFPSVRPLFVLLTVDGEEASDEDWLPYSYADVHRVLERTARTTGASLGADVAAFLDHYLRLLKGRFMNDDEIDRLCRQIYKNHREAIDLIYERGGGGEVEVFSYLSRRLLESDERWRVLQANSTRMLFVKPAWLARLAPISEDESDGRRSWLVLQVSVKHGRCFLGLRTRSVTDRERRNEVIERLCVPNSPLACKPSFKTWKQQKRVTVWYEKVDEWEEGEEIDGDVLAKKVMEQLQACLPKIEAVFAMT